MSGLRPVVGFLALISSLVGASYLVTVPPLLLWGLVGVASVAAVALGVYRYRPRYPERWWLLAGSLAALTIGGTAHLVVGESAGPDPSPLVAHVAYLAGFVPLATVAVLRLARCGAPSADRASLLDAAVITAGLGLLSWTFMIRPWLSEPALSNLEKLTAVAYPVGGLLVLITIARLATAVRWTPAVALFVFGAAGMIIAVAAHGMTQPHGAWTVGGPTDLGWFALFAGWGAAALHPSMVNLTKARAAVPGGLSPRRLRVLSLGTLIAVLALVVEATSGNPVDTVVAAVLTAAMLLIVLSRLSAAVEVQRRGLARERGLRVAGTALVAATEIGDVTDAVRTAVAQLLPPDTPHRVVLVSDEAPGRPEPGTATDARSGGETSHASFRGRRDLDPALARQLGNAEVALRCPLSLTGGSRQGGLYIAAPEPVLVALPPSMMVLASQAALALERIRLTEAINQHTSEEYFRTLVQNAADVILIVNDDDTIRYASPSAATVLGAERLAGRGVQELVPAADRAAVDRVLARLRSGVSRRTATADWTVLTPQGNHLQVEALGRDLRSDRTVAGLVITLRDVTEQRRLERELTYRAYHDALTGLANRDLLSERVERALARCDRQGSVVGVLFLDLDDLKLVNDTMGHAVGDELLVAASRRLSEVLCHADTVARLGGDEFAALVQDARSPQEVEQVAAEVVAAFDEPFLLGGRHVSGAVSVGVATTAEARDAGDLLRQADLALYLAKGAGKAQWRRYEAAGHDQVLRRVELRAALSRAVTDDAFRLVYQPIVELSGGRTVGMEALLRWEHPTRGVVGPGEFIAEAEENGLIVPIGGWVLRQALADAAGWCGEGEYAGQPYLSVNVSARQLRQPGFLTAVRVALDRAELAPQCLVMEITERVLLRDDEEVWADLAALRKIGVRVAIDDFGTGYSSLSYLRQAPIDMIKIERSFLDTISASTSQLAVVDGIVRLAHTLGLEVVAEGIETAEDRDLLVEVGCRYGQGYLFSRPLPLDHATSWLVGTHAVA